MTHTNVLELQMKTMEKNLDIALPKDQVLALPETLLHYGIDQVT